MLEKIDKRLDLKLGDSHMKWLRKGSKKTGISMAGIIRGLIKEKIDNERSHNKKKKNE